MGKQAHIHHPHRRHYDIDLATNGEAIQEVNEINRQTAMGGSGSWKRGGRGKQEGDI